MMHCLPALLMVILTSEAGHMATLAMVIVAVLLAAGVGICMVRSRRAAVRGLASNTGACSSVTGCCRR